MNSIILFIPGVRLSKSKNDLDWEPKTNIEDGIKSTIDWYSSFQDKIKNFTYIN